MDKALTCAALNFCLLPPTGVNIVEMRQVIHMYRTLKGKISLVYVGLVILMAVISIVLILNISGLQKMIDSLFTANYKSISAISKMQEAIERQDSAELTYMAIDKDRGIDLFTRNGKTFMEFYTVESNNITEHGEKTLVEELKILYNRYTEMFSTLQETENANGEKPAEAYYNSDIVPAFNNMKDRLRDLIALNENAMFKGKSTVVQNAQNSIYFFTGISAAAVISGFFLARFFANRFLSPLYQLARSIGNIGEGKMGQKIEIKAKDETAHLAKEFNSMTERLHQYEQSTLGILLNEKNKSIAIVRSISDPIIVMDNDLKIVLINKACETYLPVEETMIKGKHLNEAIKNDKLSAFIADAASNPAPGKEKIFYLPNEGGSYFNIVVTPFPVGKEQPEGFIVLMQNITEIKKLEKIKTDFFATVSHEFKTPLTSILMGASLLEEKGRGDISKEQYEILQTIKEDGERLSALVSDMLELSRIESGKAVYHLRPCSVNAIMEESMRQFTNYAETKRVELICKADKNLPEINADFEKITWVFNNLISNALKYTDATGKITVSARRGRNAIEIKVADTGTGIPTQYLKKLFDRYSLIQSQEIETRGSGLGLAVVKEIITAHHGKISVESEPGTGSVFTFTLPIAERSRST